MFKFENLSLTFCCPLTPSRWGEGKGEPPKGEPRQGRGEISNIFG